MADRDLELLVDEYWERRCRGESVLPEDEEAKPLLEIALQIREMSKAGPSPSFTEALRARLLRRAVELRPTGLHLPMAPRRLAAALAFVFALVFVGGGIAVAAQNSLPGEILYPVKRGTERVMLMLNLHSSARVELRLDFAERRTEEVERLANGGREIGASVLNDLALETEESVDEVERSERGRESLLERLAILTQRQQEVLRGVWEKVPEEAKAALERAMEASERGHERAVRAIDEHQPEPKEGGQPEEPPGQEKRPPNEAGPPEGEGNGKGKNE